MKPSRDEKLSNDAFGGLYTTTTHVLMVSNRQKIASQIPSSNALLLLTGMFA